MLTAKSFLLPLQQGGGSSFFCRIFWKKKSNLLSCHRRLCNMRDKSPNGLPRFESIKEKCRIYQNISLRAKKKDTKQFCFMFSFTGSTSWFHQFWYIQFRPGRNCCNSFGQTQPAGRRRRKKHLFYICWTARSITRMEVLFPSVQEFLFGCFFWSRGPKFCPNRTGNTKF